MNLALALATLATSISAEPRISNSDLSDYQYLTKDLSSLFSDATKVLEKPAFDIAGKPIYQMLYDDRSYCIIDPSSQSILQSGITDGNPFFGKDTNILFSTNGWGPLPFVFSDGEGIYAFEPGDSPIRSLNPFNGDDDDYEWYTSGVVLNSTEDDMLGATKIPNYEYFYRLHNWHAFNDCNICTLVSYQMLFGYYDSFNDDAFIPEIWDRPASIYEASSPFDWRSFSQMPGAGYSGGLAYDRIQGITYYQYNDKEDHRMREWMIDNCLTNNNPYVLDSGNNCSEQLLCIYDYLEYANLLTCTDLSFCEGNLSDAINCRALSFIKDTIDAGRPVIANGHHHSVVAFAYDNDRVYVHTGWGSVRSVPQRFFTDWDLLYTPSAIDVRPTQAHKHCNNFYSTSNKTFYCSCGQNMAGTVVNFNTLGLPSSASTIPGSSYHALTPGYSNTSFLAAKYSSLYNSITLDAGLDNAYLQFQFTTKIGAAYLMLDADVPNSYVGNFCVQFKDLYGSWGDPISLTEFTNLYYGTQSEIILNAEKTSKGIRISAPRDATSQPKLIIRSLAFALC